MEWSDVTTLSLVNPEFKHPLVDKWTTCTKYYDMNETMDISWLLQTALKGELDLSYLSCETVNVSFAAVNATAMSDYSPSVEHLIYGGMLEFGKKFSSMYDMSAVALHVL